MRIRPRLPLAAAAPMLQLLPLISLRSWSIGKSTTSRVGSSRLIAALVRCYRTTGSPRAAREVRVEKICSSEVRSPKGSRRRAPPPEVRLQVGMFFPPRVPFLDPLLEHFEMSRLHCGLT